MSTQSLLPLPPVPQPRVLSIEQLRALIETALAALEAEPSIGAQLAGLRRAMPGHGRAALHALYQVAPAHLKPLLRTTRHLAQLLIDAEAHEARQPGAARAVTIGRPSLAEILAEPPSLEPEPTTH